MADHLQDHPHDHDHAHDHDHQHGGGMLRTFAEALHLPGFAHTHDQRGAEVLPEGTGTRTVWIALLILGITTLLQVGIYLASGSVALLGDTVHNLGDGLNSIPLLIAFYLARRPATRRYNYGYGRAEDVAGVLIVISIIFSAVYILIESIQKLLNPQPLTNLAWVAAAAIIGFIGNELVAVMQIRVGKRIGSDAMIVDGQHARIDGYTSLAVLAAAVGAALGAPILDPLIGIGMAVIIAGISWSATKAIWYRLMDAVDPALVARLEHAVGHVDGVQAVAAVRARWVGHQLHADITVHADSGLSLMESRAIVDEVRAALGREMSAPVDAVVNVEPEVVTI
ncbi:MAG: cation diffusion facilitator family transporter [Anaerolineae bacterium]